MKKYVLVIMSSLSLVYAKAQTNVNKLEATGSAGVGTTNPAQKLELYDNIPPYMQITNTADLLTPVGGIKFNMSGTDVGLIELERTIATGRQTALKFFVRGPASLNEAMRITATGNVGIGTNAPNYKLHVLETSPNSYDPSSTTLVLPAGILSQLSNTGIGDLKGAFMSSNTISSGGVNQTTYWGSVSTTSGFSPDFVIGQRTALAGYSERMRILSNGNVAIGTTTATTKLYVAGPIAGENGVVSNSDMGTGGFQLANTSKTLRWIIRGLNTETGTGNGGYDLDILRRGDDGSAIGSALYIRRSDGNVGIGTATPGSYKLAVEGTIGARKIKVTAGPGWPDFVFEPGYQLPALHDLEAFIKTNKHLPDVPSAKDVEDDKLDLGEMDKKLLQKVEELTLYIIDLKKENETLKKQNEDQLNELLKRIEKLEQH
ncbi:hypothetical protein F0L74_07705 [Chitinophaga agrisoli]|uniref:Endosialidase-like protein n=1 Tax=Chitinophaga agrisoli TaxID=2607653 RepID=A0A5B2VRQ1_9BACT|nr:hypothetical protein [Chitinophaga agrisoli]KAA2242423.1 hypothetical protein F0L74_07705 [Chitinophaga agrisoli]